MLVCSNQKFFIQTNNYFNINGYWEKSPRNIMKGLLLQEQPNQKVDMPLRYLDIPTFLLIRMIYVF